MSLTPLIELPATIQIHTALALLAVLLGPFVIYRTRRDRVHKTLGYVWVGAMVGVAISAFFIPSTLLPLVGPFGPIHGLAVLVLYSLGRGIVAIRNGDIRRHKAELRGLYWQGLAIAGLLTLLPGRVLNDALFSAAPNLGLAVVILGGLALAYGFVRSRRSAPHRGKELA